MKQSDFILKSERGTVLVVTLLILVILTIIGIVVVTTSTRDIQIAGYDKLYKKAFYNADAGISFFVGTSPNIEPPFPNPNPGPSNEITVPAGSSFKVYYLQNLGGDPQRIEIQSNGEDVFGNPKVSIIAGYQYPSEEKGALPEGGYEGTY